MRKFLVFLCATTSLGEQFSLESTSLQLRDHVSQLVLNGGTRGSGMATVQKNMVDRLLSQMGTKLDDAAKKLLVKIQELLAQLLTDLREDKTEKQALLDNAYAAFNDVKDSTLRDTFDANVANWPIKHGLHSTCRCEQKPLHVIMETKCNSFEAWMSVQFTGTSLICTGVYDADTNEGLHNYKLALINGKNSFDTAKENYPEQHDLCEAAMTAEESKEVECEQLRKQFELFECESEDQRDTMCNHENTEYNRFKGDFDILKMQIEPLSTQRVTDARMIKYLDCLVDKLRTTVNPDLATMENECAGVRDENIDADFANTFEVFPDQEICPEFKDKVFEDEALYPTPLTYENYYTEEQMDKKCPDVIDQQWIDQLWTDQQYTRQICIQ